MDYTTYESNQSAIVVQDFVKSTYGWMAAGLALTGLVATYIASNTNAITFLVMNSWIIWTSIIVQFIMVFSISATRISGTTSMFIFIIYALLTGVNFSFIFLAYAKATIANAFFSTAGMFGAMAVYGHTTRKDLTAIGSIGFMVLIGIIIASLVNIFLHSSMLDFIISIVGVIVFAGLTAYDAQKIKWMAQNLPANNQDSVLKMSILGALALYLDFINMFLMLLRLFGRRD